MKLPKWHATSLYGQPARTTKSFALVRRSVVGRPEARLSIGVAMGQAAWLPVGECMGFRLALQVVEFRLQDAPFASVRHSDA
jgi:hypothetical protein